MLFLLFIYIPVLWIISWFSLGTLFFTLHLTLVITRHTWLTQTRPGSGVSVTWTLLVISKQISIMQVFSVKRCKRMEIPALWGYHDQLSEMLKTFGWVCLCSRYVKGSLRSPVITQVYDSKFRHPLLRQVGQSSTSSNVHPSRCHIFTRGTPPVHLLSPPFFLYTTSTSLKHRFLLVLTNLRIARQIPQRTTVSLYSGPVVALWGTQGLLHDTNKRFFKLIISMTVKSTVGGGIITTR